MSKMSELDLAIKAAANEMHYVLDDDAPDKMDELICDIAYDFNIYDTEWIRQEIEKAY